MDRTFKIGGEVSWEGQASLIDIFLRGQIGAGEDKSEAEIRDSYKISLEWFPEEDRIVVSSDTGNKGLRDGILYDVLDRLVE